MRASSLESSAESENSAMETGDGNSGQVAAISSTASFKSPAGSMGINDDDTNGEKQVKVLKHFSFSKFSDQREKKKNSCPKWENIIVNISLLIFFLY